ncbi:MAG: PAS domain-containing protein [Candidatus Zixiibacteriota bacterium]
MARPNKNISTEKREFSPSSRLGIGIALGSLCLILLVVDFIVIHGGRLVSGLDHNHLSTTSEAVFTLIEYLCVGASILYLLHVLLKDRQLSLTLEERNRFIENITCVAPVHLYIYDLERQTTVYANEPTSEILGYTPKEVYDMGPDFFARLAHPDDFGVILEAVQKVQVAKDTDVIEMEYRIRHKDGRWRWLRNSGKVFKRNAAGEPVLYIGTAIDITEAHNMRAEKENLVGVLLESETRFRAAADGSLDGFYLLRSIRDDSGTIVNFEFVFVNAIGEKMLNLDGFTIIGKKISKVQTLPRFIDYYETFLRVIDLSTTHEEELSVRSADDVSTVYIASIVKSGDGVAVTLRDITERAESSKQLRISEERYQLATSSARMAVWEWDIATGQVYHAPIMQEILGYSDDTFPKNGDEWRRILHPEDAEQFSATIQECVNGGTPEFEARCRLLTASGNYEWIVSRGHTVRDSNGKPKSVIGTTTFITADVEREQEMAMLKSAVTNSGSMVIITNTTSIIEYVNPQFSLVTGYSSEEAIGKPVNLVKSGLHEKSFYEELWRTINSGKVFSARLQNRRKNGSLYWVRQTISSITDAQGRTTHFVSVGQDITNEVNSQQKLAEAEKLAATGMLAAGVAHEFKNYLGGIVGNATFALSELESGADPALAKEAFEHIVEIGERANEVVMSLLSYSKAQTDQYMRQDVLEIVTRTVNLIGKEMKKLSIEITTVCHDDIPPVDIVPGKIQQVLLNLIINARDAIQQYGTITVVVSCDNKQVHLRVGDSGGGISPENMGRIFDPFFSTKGVWGKDQISGTGMGLAIARNIARDHGGDLTVESKIGMGTTFTLSLPIPASEKVRQSAKDGIFLETPTMCLLTHDAALSARIHADALPLNIHIHLVDASDTCNRFDLSSVQLVLCDCRVSENAEHFKIIEQCRQYTIPYVLLNCHPGDSRLRDVAEFAAECCEGVPTLETLLPLRRIPAEVQHLSLY